MAISRDIIQKYIDTALKSEVLEDNFIDKTSPHEDEPKTGSVNCSETKGILLTISTNSEPDKIIKHYVNLMSKVKSPTKFNVLFNMLRLLVDQHPNLGKAVCEALLSCEKLDYHNQNSWMQSFGLICEILPHVDYKGVRDILKYILEIIYSLPDRFDIAIIPQLDTLYATFSMILDREACLLPAYLSLDELQKKIAQGSSPIWKFAELFYHFIESFRPTALLFSIVNRSDLLPVVGCSTCHGNPSWRLDAISAKFQLKGLLPYKDKLKEPQFGQLRYLLEQPYSRDMIYSVLSLSQKPSPSRCSELIEQIALSLVHAMENTEYDIEVYQQSGKEDFSERLFQWLHKSNNIHYIGHYQASICYNHLLESLCSKIRAKKIRRGREFLMWGILQYITGTQKTGLQDFVVTQKLFDVLYPGRIQLPLVREESPMATYVYAAASIWFHLVKRAEADQKSITRPIPPTIQLHYDYISRMRLEDTQATNISYRDAVFLNAHGTSKSNAATKFINHLTKIDITDKNPENIQPLPVNLLDSLTTHSKIALTHAITNCILNLAQNKVGTHNGYLLTSALIETYGRLMIYTDIESFALKPFVNSLMGGPTAVWRSQTWHIYHVLLEMFNHRIHHVPMPYKFHLLMQLHSISPMILTANMMQLLITAEATELKLLLGLSNFDVLNMPSARHPSDTKTLKLMINGDSEELNKVLVLVLARSTQITASEQVTMSFLEDILADINKVTPLSWSSSTLSFFPTVIKDFFAKNTSSKETDRGQLRPLVEEEYRKWNAMQNESTLVAHFSQPNAPPLFICVLWKMLLDNDSLNPVVYKILDNIRIRALSAQLRTFVDYLVFEFANSVGGQHVNKYAEALNDLIWKFQIISLDRILLCMCLRSFDGCEAQVCFFIIQLLLLKISDFKSTVQTFTRMQYAEHWKPAINTYRINMDFQRRYPEKFYHDFLAENNIPSTGQTLPSFFSNICLRFIPVFDILIHRALELRIVSPNAAIKIDALLDEFGCLYRFHDQPLTYLYNTLHYYDSQLSFPLKRKLTATIIGAFNDLRPQHWCLSEVYTQHLLKSNQLPDEWTPDQDYYRRLIGRLVDTLQNRRAFYHTDWRFNEFLNSNSHAVYSTAIELMSLPLPSSIVGNAILDLVLNSYINQDRSTMSQWMNAIGLVMTALPQSYYLVLNSRILDYMKSPLLTNPIYTKDILHLMNFCDSHKWMYESQISYLVALTHAIWHHSSTGQIFYLPDFWRKEVKQAVETESQFLFVCCLIGPFLPRIERSKVLMDVVVDLYEMLEKVDGLCEIQHLNTICDFLYHIKYMFTGDAVKNDLERCIRNFKPKLQSCLRFITHLNVNSDQTHKLET